MIKIDEKWTILQTVNIEIMTGCGYWECCGNNDIEDGLIICDPDDNKYLIRLNTPFHHFITDCLLEVDIEPFCKLCNDKKEYIKLISKFYGNLHLSEESAGQSNKEPLEIDFKHYLHTKLSTLDYYERFILIRYLNLLFIQYDEKFKIDKYIDNSYEVILDYWSNTGDDDILYMVDPNYNADNNTVVT